MRRALASLKYVPAVLCGLLVVAWVVSIGSELAIDWTDNIIRFSLVLRAAQFHLHCESEMPTNVPTNRGRIFEFSFTDFEMSWRHLLGHAFFGYWRKGFFVRAPLIPAVTLLIPLALGPFTRFRFLLWSYFAWTALIAAELAYYLR